MNIIAQSFVGFCAHVLSWARDLSRRKREALATAVLEYAVPCQHLSPEIHFLSEEVKSVQYEAVDSPRGDDFDGLRRHMQQLSEDYARVVDDNRSLRQELNVRSEELQRLKRSLEEFRAQSMETELNSPPLSARAVHEKLTEDLPPLLPRRAENEEIFQSDEQIDVVQETNISLQPFESFDALSVLPPRCQLTFWKKFEP